MITLRWKDKVSSQVSAKCISARCEGIICLVIIAFGGFLAGLCYRFSGSFIIIIFAAAMAILGAVAVQFRQVSTMILIILIVCISIQLVEYR